ncbi:hypothetical protein DUNSADRAFT_11114 [Dunaliella salina]|uniref:Membrane magnesium transporter n=1 Tax=Dunaliella salina TaxID=3046 RepID=A0ABQ7H4T7_DUNSA|nr:hypothetical protein DUNSADRAFT_11114 [Dunaliella salina]|eukprot:KAF5841798.1 hypothetical protein DUNSADRAFT_11114 [Dunaliella salina]
MVSVAGTVTLLGFLGMFHVMFAVIKHREMLKLLQEDMESIPPALLMELIITSSCAVAGAFLMAGSLKSVVSSKNSGSVDIGRFKLDFVSFNTRSKALPSVDPLT